MTHVISYLAPLRNGERPSKDRPKVAQMRLPPHRRIRCEYEPGFKTRGIHARPRKAEITSKFEGEISEWCN